MKTIALRTSLLALLTIGTPAFAGMGAVRPTYHPAPCKGADCRADDEHSGLPCQGLLCSFSSAKSMQKPVTASEAAEMQAKAAAAPPVAAPIPDAPKKKKKAAAARAKPATLTADAEKPEATAPSAAPAH